ncbi:Indoleamine 2,3-dioxygenase [Cladorrhinum samala]|uniref:Indoleamine 2,3-dioxygenase n=1 Tax=Cladorrhinum samala TaxID=585594 RepID=A0AAV9HLI1_9PEZI|nr:Indoleamine 2,3-dioxygenase [Cladorrhinum samala]
MSPCEPLPLPKTEFNSNIAEALLEDFDVTSNGFLPEEQPLETLPDSYYEPWESLVKDLPAHLQAQTLRARVDELPVLSTAHLKTVPEWRRAYVVLGFLAHGYIWGGEKASEILPPQITVPLLAVSSHLSIPPVATYAAVNLWNFRSTNPDFSSLDSLSALHTYTGTRDESWFYMVSVAMEALGGQTIIPLLLSSLQACSSRSTPALISSISDITSQINTLGTLLDRMDEHCNPSVFYHRIRPFLAGSKNMASAGLPRGVFYDQGDGKGEWMQLRGGSNGQSSLIQLLDVVLGVEHKVTGDSNPDRPGHGGGGGGGGKEMSFHREVRGYMPEAHRRFLTYVEERWPGGLRRGVEGLLAEGMMEVEEQVRLREAFRIATEALAGFRNRHLRIVTRYIVIPSRQGRTMMAPERGERTVNLATASSRLSSTEEKEGHVNAELTGTGGTALLPFLKQSRDETFRAGELRT